ncbi:ImmA/IrrE family metallo-endopeptidase [Paenibacillus sp. WC2504]|uniref:ImmA/IrrE family metallo-endopeptidase n=1 Tax=Paenibacillus sp. WC2504 TaxID=3461403 RepID=UPI0040467035
MTPTKCAQQVLQKFNVTTTPALSLEQIFGHYKIIYDEIEYNDPNFMGSLIRAEGKAIILVNTDIKNTGRINFTKAHELGHFCLNHKGQRFECSRTDMLDNSRNSIEVEANQFAKEFLLPEHMVRPICLSAPFDFETIRGISSQFLVSKLTAAFRILDFHLGNYAFTYSQNGIITHSKVSNSLAGKIFPKSYGEMIHTKSFAYSVLNSDSKMNIYETIDSTFWVRNNLTSKTIALKELSRANKISKTVMTLLKFDFL